MKKLRDIPLSELATKRVLVRAGLNVPLTDTHEVADTFRIQAVLPTLRYLATHAQSVTVLGHIGRQRSETLAPVIRVLQEELKEFSNITYRENVRQDPREVANDPEYAKELSVGHDMFVQDAFPDCHRAHASIVGIPQILPSYAGFLLEEEIAHLTAALHPPRPALFVLGGAKFGTKEPLIRKFLKRYDKIFIGGAIANEFFAARGYEVGYSLVHDRKIPSDILYHDKIVLPDEVLVAGEDGHSTFCNPREVAPTMRIVDVRFPSDLLSNPEMHFVVWNGPLGYYEGGYTTGTLNLKTMLQHSRAEVVIGGGDTIATIGGKPMHDHTYLSAGGGAMLTFLEEGTLPGITALG